MKRAVIALFIAVVSIVSARGQGFLNLDFESAHNLTNNAYIPSADALPDWTAYDGSVALSDIYYVSNTFTGVGTIVELEGGSLALNGDFSVGLYGGSISQTGLVPVDAELLQFDATTISSPDMEVILGGQTLSYSALSEGPGYTVYEANIPTSLAGHTEALTFLFQGPSGVTLDNIEFGVPEPPECALIGLGAILFGLWRRKLKPQRAQRSQKS